jgi:hypothetical protein
LLYTGQGYQLTCKIALACRVAPRRPTRGVKWALSPERPQLERAFVILMATREKLTSQIKKCKMVIDITAR